MSDALASSFREHLGIRLEGIAQDLQKTGYSALVLVSGGQYFYFRDDQPAPYRANAHFLHFCPLEGPGHLLLLRPEKKPLLATFSPDDFWYEPQRIGDAFWTEGFKIVECSSRKRQISEIAKRLPKGRAAAIGESGAVAEALGLAQNPPALLTRLDWRRAIKTAYEVECIGEANRLGAAGHIAAEGAFQDGGSELDSPSRLPLRDRRPRGRPSVPHDRRSERKGRGPPLRGKAPGRPERKEPAHRCGSPGPRLRLRHHPNLRRGGGRRALPFPDHRHGGRPAGALRRRHGRPPLG